MATRIPLPIMNPEFNESTAPAESASAPSSSGLRTRAEGGDIFEEIKKEVTENRVMLYMKGNPQMPQCGFSARAVQILQHLGVTDFGYANILTDPEKRQGIKDFTEWPTIPQLYIDGEFVGGSDIITEMFQSGELQQALGLE